MKITDVTDFFGVTDTKKKQELEPEKGKLDRDDLGPQKVLLKWEGVPKAATTTLNPRYRKTLMIIGVVIVFLLVLMKEFFLILVVASLYFVSHVMAKNPLDKFKYTISTYGFNINDRLYYWDEIVRFFFSSHYSDEEEYLAVDLKEGLPSRLIIGFEKNDKDKIIDAMNKYVPYLDEEPLTFVDKAYKSVIGKFDLDKKK